MADDVFYLHVVAALNLMRRSMKNKYGENRESGEKKEEKNHKNKPETVLNGPTLSLKCTLSSHLGPRRR